jgi:hypothetical protein
MEEYKLFQRMANLLKITDASGITIRKDHVSYSVTLSKTGALEFDKHLTGERKINLNKITESKGGEYNG